MKKYLIYNLAALGLIIGTFVACEYSQDVEPVVSPDGYPKLTFTPAEAYSSLDEGDTIYLNVTSDKMIERALTFDVHVVGGDGDDNDILVTQGVIAPYSNDAQVMVIFPQDWDAEPTENISLEFGIYSTGEKYLVHQTTEYPVLDLTVTNFVSDDLTISIGWEKAIKGTEEVGGTVTLPNGVEVDWVDTVEAEYNAADEFDFDILISPADIFDPADPWASEIGNYSAATGANPEVMTVGLEDGEYILWADLYSNPLAPYLITFDDTTEVVPLSANFKRQGTTLNVDVLQDDEQAPFVNTLGYDEDGNFQGVIAKIVVSGGVYTIVDYEDESEYGAARKSARTRTPRPAHLKR
jgi:hypothetical protein